MNYFGQQWAIWFSKSDGDQMYELFYDRGPVIPTGTRDKLGRPSGGTKFLTIEDAVRALDWCKAHYDPDKYHFSIATYSVSVEKFPPIAE